jgi:hypothetical protein
MESNFGIADRFWMYGWFIFAFDRSQAFGARKRFTRQVAPPLSTFRVGKVRSPPRIAKVSECLSADTAQCLRICMYIRYETMSCILRAVLWRSCGGATRHHRRLRLYRRRFALFFIHRSENLHHSVACTLPLLPKCMCHLPERHNLRGKRASDRS